MTDSPVMSHTARTPRVSSESPATRLLVYRPATISAAVARAASGSPASKRVRPKTLSGQSS